MTKLTENLNNWRKTLCDVHADMNAAIESEVRAECQPQVAELEKQLAESNAEARRQMQHVETVLQQLAESKKDAERLRDQLVIIREAQKIKDYQAMNLYIAEYGVAAIDAARQEEGEKK